MGINFPESNNSAMHIWLETEGNRGSREITSCLYKTMNERQRRQPHKEWILWSDSCGGQNRNITMLIFLLRMVYSEFGIGKIIHRFPETGHSFLPNDQDFCLIEKAKQRAKPIYSVDEYTKKAVLGARSKPSPFKAIRMTSEYFVDLGVDNTNFKNLLKPVDSNGVKFCWLSIKEFVYEKGIFGFFFRYDVNEELRLCFLGNPGGRSRRPDIQIFNTPNKILGILEVVAEGPISQIFNTPNKILGILEVVAEVPLKKQKWSDLQALLQCIPPIHQNFYKGLPHEEDDDDDLEVYPDLTEDEGDNDD